MPCPCGAGRSTAARSEENSWPDLQATECTCIRLKETVGCSSGACHVSVPDVLASAKQAAVSVWHPCNGLRNELWGGEAIGGRKALKRRHLVFSSLKRQVCWTRRTTTAGVTAMPARSQCHHPLGDSGPEPPAIPLISRSDRFRPAGGRTMFTRCRCHQSRRRPYRRFPDPTDSGLPAAGPDDSRWRCLQGHGC